MTFDHGPPARKSPPPLRLPRKIAPAAEPASLRVVVADDPASAGPVLTVYAGDAVLARTPLSPGEAVRLAGELAIAAHQRWRRL
jgi:hypothetical protein